MTDFTKQNGCKCSSCVESKKMSKDIIEKARVEFNINVREWEHLCFEGNYIPEILEFALQERTRRIHQWLIDEYGIGFYTKDIPNQFFKKWVGK